MIRIILVPGNFISDNLANVKNIRLALNVLDINPVASVEAEYGNFVLEGTMVTLAHHAKEWRHNPPPCIVEVDPLPQDVAGDIIVSHLDLDTIGGCLTLCGNKPEDDNFWNAAAYIDLHGIHHLPDLAVQVQDQLNAFYAWKQKQSWPYFSEISDVTEHVARAAVTIVDIIKNDKKLIEAGKTWQSEIESRLESSLLCENSQLRIFRPDGNVFTASSYYSPQYERIVKSTISFNTNTQTLTLAFEDGGKEFSASEIMQKLFGSGAGGHPGIAGSPRGQSMTEIEFDKLCKYVNQLLHND